MDSNVKLSNVIGAPFSDYVLLQLYIRAARNSTTNRTNEEVLFLANKTAWARLVSSVNITNDVLGLTYKKLNVDYNTPDALAKNWILEAGTSKQDGNGISLRSGIGPDGAYGLGGTEELGYRPMPGLTGVTIETTGRLGSLRQATINFKVWNINQLSVIEALYFRLGYSMLLEWGHTQYFDNKNNFERTGIYGIDDPFASNQRKETIQQAIALKARNSFGNYDGMLGIVSNFSWSMNQDGGYDCTVKLVGLGSVMDSMRINQAYTLPDGLLKEYKKNKSALATADQARLAALEAKIRELQNPTTTGTGQSIVLDPAPKNLNELYDRAKKYDNFTGTLAEFIKTYGIARYTDKYQFLYPDNGIYIPSDVKVDPFYFFNIPFTNNGDINVKNAVTTAYGGLWYNKAPLGWKKFTPSTLTSIKFDTDLLNKAVQASLEVNGNDSESVKQDKRTLDSKLSSASKSTNSLTNYFAVNTSTVEGLTATGAALKVIDRASVIGVSFNLLNTLGIGTETISVPLTDPLPNGKATAIYVFGLAPGRLDNGNSLSYTTIEATWTDVSFRPTRQELYAALDIWQAQGGRLDGVTYSGVGSKFKISGTFSQKVVAKYNGPDNNRDNAIAVNPGYDGDKNLKEITVTFKVTTDNPGFIADVLTSQPKEDAKAQNAQTANTGATNGSANQADNAQTNAVESFASALQAMLTVVQTQVQRTGSDQPKVGVLGVSIKSQTEKFFQSGIMNGVLNPSNTPEATADLSTSKFNLIQYASKGFNSQLMIDPDLYNSVPTVDFDTLCKAFLIRYTQGGDDQSLSVFQAPVYIQFGYLLAFLNNMCLIYDSPESKIPTNNNAKKGTPKRPYVYIDFNPETNFCLTSPQQLSVDPYTCLIPLDGDQDSYKQIFPENLRTKITPLFDPSNKKENKVTGGLHGAGLYYKSPTNAYQGKIMNILLNVDYLLGLTKSFAGSDPEHSVKLELFLNKIVEDINKALGNVNVFRVAYRDDSNTIQIQDDQWVPSLIGTNLSEKSVLSANEYNSRLKTDPEYAGLIPVSGDPKELPVVGNLGLARQFQLRSVMSTKLASMIAISAQAATGSVNAKDHSSLSYLNQHFQDRYKPYIQNASNGEAGSNNDSKNKDEKSNDQQAAELFNDHVTSIYSNLNLSAERIDLARNYYIERMSEVKALDTITSAAPFMPAELEMTLDGISGIIMGNAFTVPQDRLPLSLRGENGLAKIAFIVTGLTHIIQNNEWVTKIKGQMIKLRQEAEIPAAKTIVTQIQDLIVETSTRSTNIISTTPWSAAFISYVMEKAGVSNFPSNITHTGYAQSLRTNPIGFLVLNPTKYKIEVGDLIVKNRNGNTLTYDTSPWTGYSHGDIVISIEGNKAVGVGGNISNAVGVTNIGLEDGRLGRSDYFVILRPPQTSVSAIVAAATAEYKLWKTNQWKELTPAAFDTLRSYYKIAEVNI